MSLYLGNQKVGVSYKIESENEISPEQMEALNEGLTYRFGTFDKKNIPQIIARLKEKHHVIQQRKLQLESPTTWQRPQNWPDLDSLNLSMSGDTDFIYMTYNANYESTAIAWHIETRDKLPAILDIGHITNGEYIVDETYSVNHNTNFIKWTDDYTGYLVLRITGKLLCCYSVQTVINEKIQVPRHQPIVERIAYIPNMDRLAGSGAWGTYSLEREKIANGDGSLLKTIASAWVGAHKLKSLDLSGLYTPQVTAMNNVFDSTVKLTELDLRHFDVSKVTNFGSCFYCCYSLQTLNLTGWDTSNATNFTSMFNGCRSLYNVYGIENFNTAKATTLASMFNTCYSLKEIPVENYNVSKVTNLSSMFSGCFSVESLDLSKWRPVVVTNISNMFTDCRSLKTINFTGWTTGTLTAVNSLFSSCYSLMGVDLSWLHLTNACTSMGSMFYYCCAIEEINIPDDWDVTGISSSNYTAYQFFNSCYNVKRITGISNWDFRFSNSLAAMFQNCWSLEEVDVSGWNVSTVTSLNSMFANCWSLKNIDVSNWYAPNALNIANMFDYCYSLEEVDLSSLKPGAFTTMSAIFRWCSSLKSIGNIKDWNTHDCTNFSAAFQDCESLSEFPPVQNWDYSAATTVSGMFQGLMSIEEITLDNLNLPLCTNISNMFGYCYNLKKVHLTGWSIPKVTSTSAGYFLGYNYCLTDVVIDIPIAVNHTYYVDDCLTHESLLNILNSLPIVTTRRTLGLYNQNINRLTATEKQIATNKNWTLANNA